MVNAQKNPFPLVQILPVRAENNPGTDNTQILLQTFFDGILQQFPGSATKGSTDSFRGPPLTAWSHVA